MHLFYHVIPYAFAFTGLLLNNHVRGRQLRRHAQKLNRDAMLRDKATELTAASK